MEIKFDSQINYLHGSSLVKCYTRNKLGHIEMNIDGEYPLCNKEEKNINHCFKTCDLASTIQIITNIHCPKSIYRSSYYTLARAYLDRNWYNKIVCNPLEEITIILEAIWEQKNSVIFHNYKCSLVEIIEHASDVYHYMLLYNKNTNMNLLESNVGKNLNAKSRKDNAKNWKPLTSDWLKQDRDVSRIEPNIQQQSVILKRYHMTNLVY